MSRAVQDHSSGVQKRVLTTLLNELDGVDSGKNKDVFFLAATNRLESVDSALVRPGRIDQKFEIGYPEEKDIESICRAFLRRTPLAADVDLAEISRAWVTSSISRLTCADVVHKCRESVLNSIRESPLNLEVSRKHFETLTQ
jgi:transitional endoplasmic reticulum ATPase